MALHCSNYPRRQIQRPILEKVELFFRVHLGSVTLLLSRT